MPTPKRNYERNMALPIIKPDASKRGEKKEVIVSRRQSTYNRRLSSLSLLFCLGLVRCCCDLKIKIMYRIILLAVRYRRCQFQAYERNKKNLLLRKRRPYSMQLHRKKYSTVFCQSKCVIITVKNCYIRDVIRR